MGGWVDFLTLFMRTLLSSVASSVRTMQTVERPIEEGRSGWVGGWVGEKEKEKETERTHPPLYEESTHPPTHSFSLLLTFLALDEHGVAAEEVELLHLGRRETNDTGGWVGGWVDEVDEYGR